MKTGVELIDLERQEQIVKHGHTSEKDDTLTEGELVGAARYVLGGLQMSLPKVFHRDDIWQIHTKSQKHQLVVAAAFLAAEIDRLNRLEEAE